jgi:outer membrane receptor for ferrienterochelin and colicin
MKTISLQRTALRICIGTCLASMAASQLVQAASTDGALAGHVTGGALDGAQVTVRNPETGFTRTVKVETDGTYRFPFLPVGKYTLEAGKPGSPMTTLDDVAVGLGNTTTANIMLGQAATLETIKVNATAVVTAVDVSSTESATNVTREELTRLPVERNAQAVALLAPGVVKGDFGGISFGGSSVAENTTYINGLNVTDFYNRIGFSEVPYAFYKEFQVKTGGYSVEFGRSTGGVINAVTRSGTNEFKFGAEAVWEPSFLQDKGDDHRDASGHPYYVTSHDEYDRSSLNLYASGPLIKDKLFFFVMAEPRSYEPINTSNSGNRINDGKADDGFWGAKVDWQINDKNLLELLAFSDKDRMSTKIYPFDLATNTRGRQQNTQFLDNGGKNWSVTYTGYLTDALSMKVLYGENKRDFSVNSTNDIECSRIRDRRSIGDGDIGCTSSASVTSRLDDRKAARMDFEWKLGDHLLRFGLDREDNTSRHRQFYPGPDRLVYEIYDTTPGATLANGGVVPDGVDAYVRTRTNEVNGSFQTLNTAYYLEDNWSVTPNLVLNLGLRREGFDNKNSDGASYIKSDNNVAPRMGFSWDVNGDGRSKLFGNLGRYFLPVANVINIKQAGGFRDERTFYAFQGLQPFEYNGATYQRPILGAQIGPVDNSQGDGSVGDLRGEVDADIKSVHQDELILGFQSMFDDKWSWGVRGTYRKLTHAIDDMEITSNGILCNGTPGYIGYIMGNPGENATVYTDTNCDGVPDGYVTIDTSRAGWALYDDNGNYVGERGWVKPKRNYKALDLQIDRAWDGKWALNATYTLAFNKGNAEGPVNSDTGFSDTGRTENFDDPWVNLGGDGYLPNDRRHQFKFRGTYGFNEHWQLGGTLNAQSGRPVSAFGVGNPFDGTDYHSNYICVDRCTFHIVDGVRVDYLPSERVYAHSQRGAGGRLPWTYDVGASITYLQSFDHTNLRVKLAVYNLLNQQRLTSVDEQLESDIGSLNQTYKQGTGYQAPRYAQFVVSLDF